MELIAINKIELQCYFYPYFNNPIELCGYYPFDRFYLTGLIFHANDFKLKNTYKSYVYLIFLLASKVMKTLTELILL